MDRRRDRAQESYLNKNGNYCTANTCLTGFDVTIPDPTTLKYFKVTLNGGAAGGVDWGADMVRGGGTVPTAPAYYGAYTISYERNPAAGVSNLTCTNGSGGGVCTDMLP